MRNNKSMARALLFGARNAGRCASWKRQTWEKYIGTRRLWVAPANLLDNKPEANGEPKNETFAEIFKRSKFVSILDPVNQKVEGVVLAVVNKNLYVDFGCKFHAVVPIPKVNEDSYRKGTRVVIRVLDLEMTNHFIGDGRDISLLEAEAELVGLA